MRRIFASVTAALILSVSLIGLNVGTAQAADCWSTFHARPTAAEAGVNNDPCSNVTVNTGNGWFANLYVQHFWSASGGMHITDIRGVMTVCASGSNIASVDARDLKLGRYDPPGGLIATQLSGTIHSTSCATMITPWKSARGCGGWDAPQGPNAYRAWVHGYWSVNTPISQGGTIDAVSHPSYYATVVGGAAC
jgi:hypothetical protein